MGAPSAREVVSVNDSYARIYDPIMGTIDVPINELPRTELMRAAAMRFPSSGVMWRNFPKEAIQDAIATGTIPAPSDDPNYPIPAPAPIIPPLTMIDEIQPERVHSHVQPEPTPVPAHTNGNGDAAQLAEMLRRVVGGAVDENKVRAIVADSVGTLIPQVADLIGQEVETATATLRAEMLDALAHLRPHVTRVEMPNRDPIEIPGRQHKDFPALLKVLGSNLHAYLVGPPGTGKTFMAHQAAIALDLPFYSISCSPTMPDSRLFGFVDATGTYRPTLFRQAYEFGGVFLFDEIDNAHPGVVAAMNQALANDYCAFPDGMVKRHDNFLCPAAANTFGTGATRQFVGRNALDAATLDRFSFMRIGIDEAIESDVTLAINPNAEIWLASVREWRANAESHSLDVIISPRSSYAGAKLLNAGFTFEECKEMTVAKGMSDDARRKVFGS